ncbi:hypothetical protein [Mycoplasmopsis sturni]|uniref:hypothetical protein n=1 Tax=Mycoplasmopsis sturni TaxID=39047 RepID=UPI00056D6E32|nr:hypothetical protein [Mycoplasmopsis sturni]
MWKLSKLSDYYGQKPILLLNNKVTNISILSGFSFLLGTIFLLVFFLTKNSPVLKYEGRIVFIILSVLGFASSSAILLIDSFFYINNIKKSNFELYDYKKKKYLMIFSSVNFLFYFFYFQRNVIPFLNIEKAHFDSRTKKFTNLVGNQKELVSLYSFKNIFKLDIIDIALSGILLGIYIGVRSTIGRLGLSFEYLFYILVSYILRYFKAAIVAFLADFMGLVITGSVGTWHWVYGIVPILSTLLLSILFDIFERNKKVSILISNGILWIAFGALFGIFIWQSSVATGESLKISNTFNYKNLSITTLAILIALGFVIMAFISGASFYYLFKKKDHEKKKLIYILLTSFALVAFTIVIFRWIWGPFAYLRWRNWAIQSKPRNISEWYIPVMLPIVLRSSISIPIYTASLVIILTPLMYLRKRYIEKKLISQY